MGLDIAEIIMDIEEQFGIEIPDSQQRIVTVGELCDYVAEQVKAVPGSDPKRAVALGQLREFFCRKCGALPDAVQEGTLLADLIPDREARLARLRELCTEVSPHLQPIGLPKWLERTTKAAVVVAGGAVFIAIVWDWRNEKPGEAFWPKCPVRLVLLSGAASVAFFGEILLNNILKKWGWAAETYRSISDLLPVIAGNLSDETSGPRVWTTEMVETKVRAIISNVADVPMSAVTREKKLVDDLGLG
jgi:acyl carrier protein